VRSPEVSGKAKLYLSQTRVSKLLIIEFYSVRNGKVLNLSDVDSDSLPNFKVPTLRAKRYRKFAVGA
jgi:hypothetical protein